MASTPTTDIDKLISRINVLFPNALTDITVTRADIQAVLDDCTEADTESTKIKIFIGAHQPPPVVANAAMNALILKLKTTTGKSFYVGDENTALNLEFIHESLSPFLDTLDDAQFNSIKDLPLVQLSTSEEEFHKNVYKHFVSLTKKQTGNVRSGEGAAAGAKSNEEVSVARRKTGSGAGGGVGGAGRLVRIKEIKKEIPVLETQMIVLTDAYKQTAAYKAAGTVPAAMLLKKYTLTDTDYTQLLRRKVALEAEFLTLSSTRDSNFYKIDITADEIRNAVNGIKTNNTYTFEAPYAFGTPTVTSIAELRTYLLENMPNDAAFLSIMTTDLGLDLDAVLGPYTEEVKEGPNGTLNDKGILVITEGTKKYEMPQIDGKPDNRKAYSKQYDKDTCFGFGPAPGKAKPLCTELLLKCINGDPKECREVLAKAGFEDMLEEDMSHTNIFMIAKLLDGIGYPRVKNGTQFTTNMNDWYERITSYFSFNASDATQKASIQAIQNNVNLSKALEQMVKKYNKYSKHLNPSKNVKNPISTMALVYGTGGNGASALLSYDGYNRLQGGATTNILDGTNRNIAAVMRMLKDLKDKSELTNNYTKLFTNVEKNINAKNSVIDAHTISEYKQTLASFKTSEDKLNKLLTLFTNFAFLLNSDDNTDPTSNSMLNNLLTADNMQKYIDARNKIMSSLKRKQTNMTIMLGPMGPMYLQ